MPSDSLDILHVITGLDGGGAERQLVQIATAARPGIRHTVVSLTPGGVHRPALEAAGIGVRDLGMAKGRPDPRALFRLAGWLRAAKPDVIQSWMYHADLLSALAWRIAGMKGRARLVWGIRCSDMDITRYPAGLRRVIGLCRRLSDWPDALIANSTAGMTVHQALGYRPRRSLVIPNGIDTTRFAPDPAAGPAVRATLGLPADQPLVAMVARVDPMKDFPTALAALGAIAPARGLLIGAGTDGLALPGNVTALGWRDDVHRLLPGCDVILSASAFGEGFSNVLAEGMACGLVPVATDVGDARLIVGDTGAVVPPGDPAALAVALRTVLADPNRAAKGAASRARVVADFGLDRAVERFLHLYRNLG